MIFISGHHNTGKSTIAKWLGSLGFHHLETGEVIRKEHHNSSEGMDFYGWVDKKNAENKNYLNDLIVDEATKIFENDPHARLIITGNRQLSGINYLKEKISNLDQRKSLILFLLAPEEELYRRQLERKDRIIPGLTFDLFKNKYLAYDEDMGIDSVRENADYVIENLRGDQRAKENIIAILKANSYLD